MDHVIRGILDKPQLMVRQNLLATSVKNVQFPSFLELRNDRKEDDVAHTYRDRRDHPRCETGFPGSLRVVRWSSCGPMCCGFLSCEADDVTARRCVGTCMKTSSWWCIEVSQQVRTVNLAPCRHIAARFGTIEPTRLPKQLKSCACRSPCRRFSGAVWCSSV